MLRATNMGVGMIVIVPEEDAGGVTDELAAAGEAGVGDPENPVTSTASRK